MELTEDNILKMIEDKRERIDDFGVKEIGLFGSYLKNEQNEESDIDILVEFYEGKKTFDNYMGLKFFLEELFDKKVDLVLKNAVKPFLKEQIMGNIKYATRV